MTRLAGLRRAARAFRDAPIRSLALALVLLPALAASARSQSGTIYGLWITDDGRGGVRIAKCGSAACGRIVWLAERLGKDGRPPSDRHNPDPKKQARTICGLQVLGGAKQQSNGSWEEGWIYDPKAGKTYNLSLSLKDAGTLTVYGYLGTKLLGQTHYWKRARGKLASCK